MKYSLLILCFILASILDNAGRGRLRDIQLGRMEARADITRGVSGTSQRTPDSQMESAGAKTRELRV